MSFPEPVCSQRWNALIGQACHRLDPGAHSEGPRMPKVHKTTNSLRVCVWGGGGDLGPWVAGERSFGFSEEGLLEWSPPTWTGLCPAREAASPPSRGVGATTSKSSCLALPRFRCALAQHKQRLKPWRCRSEKGSLTLSRTRFLWSSLG